MKAVYLLLINILFVLSVSTSFAQNVNTSAEKKYNDETYIIDDNTSQNNFRASGAIQKGIKITVANKNKAVFDNTVGGACYVPKETTPLTEVFKKAVSKEKIKSLANNDKNRITIRFSYNVKTGRIIYMWFILSEDVILSDDINSDTCITLRDINKMETLFKEYYFEIPIRCDNKDAEYGGVFYPFIFSKLAAAE
jgi:hypothetical protein